jgi:hypothetical protein
MKNDESKAVTVRIQSGNTEALKDANLYVFDNTGQLLESVSLSKGEVSLRTKAAHIEGQTQMYIGPVMPKEYKGKIPDAAMMKRMGAFQPAIHMNADHVISINALAKLPALHWNWCLITGEVSKTFNIDGQSKTLPLCDARVHVCEIDRIQWWWKKIPVQIIDDLGEKLKEIILNPRIKFPPIGPDPGPDPRFAAELSLKADMGKMQRIKTAKRTATLPALPAHIQTELLSESHLTVRDSIYKNFHLLHPYLCYWPIFWPYFYRSQEIGTVYTDCNGRYNLEYFNFTNDKDIYIWLEVCINGQWVTVYRPSIPCHTKWNYACGTDINIRVSDPRVLPCTCGQQLQGEIVWFRSIGESATALHIEQDDAQTINVQGGSYFNVGCTDIIDSHRISPFGSNLNFKLLFGDGLPKNGITHYRWKKIQLRDAALNNVVSAGATVVSGSVQKTYFVITTDPVTNHMHFETKAVTLGAEGTGENIGYRIPHWNIYQDPGVPAADKLLTIQWTSPDFWSASLDSNSLADGLWNFELELLQLDAGGVYQVVQVPKQVFQVSDFKNSGNSIDAPDNYLNINSGNPANAFNLMVKVRIDNAHCQADIQDANITVNGVTEYSGRCGFLHYTDVGQKVHISFIATQARNFATFSFSVVKGNGTENPGISEGGYVNSSVGIYILSGGVYADNVNVSQLLGTCPKAAFAENLYVASLATDGTRRLHEYDASDTNAFALSNV